MTVDHILPERLGEHLTELAGLRREYEIDEIFPGFQINDYTNWVPAHPKCNIRKGSDIFPKKMTLLLLQDVQRHLDRVYEQLDVIARGRNRSRLLGSLGSAIENSHLTVEQVREFIMDIERSQHAGEPLVITFSLAIDDVVESSDLPAHVGREYPVLCDWLELDLVTHLRSIITTPFHYTQPSDRSGEGLSVRIVFPHLNTAELDRLDLKWWEILEAASFWDIFGESYTNAFPDLPHKEYFGQREAD